MDWWRIRTHPESVSERVMIVCRGPGRAYRVRDCREEAVVKVQQLGHVVLKVRERELSCPAEGCGSWVADVASQFSS